MTMSCLMSLRVAIFLASLLSFLNFLLTSACVLNRKGTEQGCYILLNSLLLSFPLHAPMKLIAQWFTFLVSL